MDPDQLASEKPADQDPHCFPLCLEVEANDRSSASELESNYGGV